jgi:uncharacterized protein YwqG
MDDLAPEVESLIRSQLRPDDAELLIREIRPAVALASASDDNRAGPVRSRLGGLPILEPGASWPDYLDKPLSLLAVLDLEEFAPMLDGTWLPGNAVVNLFYEVDEQPWGFDPDDRFGWRVIPADPSSAGPREAPSGATTFREIPLVGRRVATYPGWEEDVMAPLARYGDRLDALVDRLEADRRHPRHQLGGWPLLQQAPWQLECQLASNGIDVGDPSGYESPAAQRLKAGADDWVMLAQIDSDDDAGWMWGDLGTLYFAMRRQDLAAGDWGRSWLVLQCG